MKHLGSRLMRQRTAVEVIALFAGCFCMTAAATLNAGWQRDMVEGTPVQSQPSAPVYTGPSAEQIAAQQAAAQREAQRKADVNQTQASNNAGLSFWNRHEWGAAVQSFRQALAKSPGNKTIQRNLEQAQAKVREQEGEQKRVQEDTHLASQMSATLQRITTAMPDFDGKNTGSVAGPAADLDFLPVAQATSPAGAAVNSSTPPTPELPWQDSSVVDLRGTTKTAVDPVAMKGTPPSPPAASSIQARQTAEPPSPNVQLPGAKDVELLMAPAPSPASAWPGARRPANQPKLTNPLDQEGATKELARAIFENPAMEDLMLKGMTESVLQIPSPPPPAVAASPASRLHGEQSPGPHN